MHPFTAGYMYANFETHISLLLYATELRFEADETSS